MAAFQPTTVLQGRFHAHSSLFVHSLFSEVSLTSVPFSITHTAVHHSMSRLSRCVSANVQLMTSHRTIIQLTTRIIESSSISISSSGLDHPQCRGLCRIRRAIWHCLATSLRVSARSSPASSANLSTVQDTTAAGT